MSTGNESGIKNNPGIPGCFQYLKSDETEILNDKKTRLTYLQAETLFKQGAFAPYVLYIVNGLVKVYLQTGYEKQINLRLSKTDDFLAFSSVFGENVYTYSTVALRDTEICMIDKSALKQLLLKNPDFAMQITSRNYSYENHLLEIIKNMSYKQMRGKLASTLLYLSSEEFSEENVFQYLTRKDLADFSSITTESAIKFIKEFEKEGLLNVDGRNIAVLNKNAMNEISMRG